MRVAVVLAVTAWLLVTGCAAPEKLPGTDLGGQPAAPFRLTDHAGRSLALDDLRGRPVALTFLYTSCPDLCPLTAQRLGQSLAKLGPDGERVAVVVISVDPANDTPEAARAFEPPQLGPIGHTDAVFLIDREGRKRSLLRGDATVDDLSRGLRALLQ